MGASEIIPQEVVASKIFFIRGGKVMLDRDLAVLYGVGTKVLNQTVYSYDFGGSPRGGVD